MPICVIGKDQNPSSRITGVLWVHSHRFELLARARQKSLVTSNRLESSASEPTKNSTLAPLLNSAEFVFVEAVVVVLRLTILT